MNPAPAATDPVIEVSGLVTRFGKRTVLNGLDFRVERGETVVIMGPSGCGKSTLLRHLIGSARPSAGSIRIFGQEIIGLSERRLRPLRLRFGMLFQSGALLQSMTVGENIALPLLKHRRLPWRELEKTVKAKLAMVGAGRV